MDRKEQEAATEIIRGYVAREGFEALTLKVAGDRVVTVTLDADPGPVSMDDCVRINRGIRTQLEESELPADDYQVAVESPGVRRALETPRHFERFVGERARLSLHEPLPDGSFAMVGKLIGFEEGRVLLHRSSLGEIERVALDEISEARLDPEYGTSSGTNAKGKTRKGGKARQRREDSE